MKWLALTEIAEPITEAPSPYAGEKPYVATGDILGSEIVSETPHAFADRPSRANLVGKPGDVLFAKMMATRKTLQLDESLSKKIYSTGFFNLRPKAGRILSRYLYWFLDSAEFQHEKNRRCTGATQKALTLAGLQDIKIPVPDDLASQERIVTVLDKAEAICQKQGKAIQFTGDFLRASFIDLFGDPVINPKNWTVKEVGRVAQCIVPGRNKPKSFTGDIPWITTDKLSHLATTRGNAAGLFLNKDEISSSGMRIVPKKSVLMTCVGDLGIVSIAGDDMVINQQLHSFQCNPGITPEFLCYALSFQKLYMESKATKTTLPYMNKAVCNSVPVIVPLPSLQEKFSSLFQAQEIASIKLMAALLCDRELMLSLSHRAFRGEL